MKTAILGICICIFSAVPATTQAGELEAKFGGFVEQRAVYLDSMSALVDTLSADGIFFSTTEERERHEQWLEQMAKSVEQTRSAAEEYRNEPSLYHAVRFEWFWKPLRFRQIQEATSSALALSNYGLISPDEGIPPEKMRALVKRSARSHEVGHAALRMFLRIQIAIMDIEVKSGAPFFAYLRAASDELERTGWSP